MAHRQTPIDDGQETTGTTQEQTSTPQSPDQGGGLVYEDVDEWTNPSCSPPDICSLSPNKFVVNQSELSSSQVSSPKNTITRHPSEPLPVSVLAILPDSTVRTFVKAHNFEQFVATVWAQRKVHVEDAFLHIKIDSVSDPVLVSVRGDGWGLLKNGLDVEVTLRPGPAPAAISPETLTHVCWNVCARHKAPLKWTQHIIEGVLAGVGLSCSISYRQVRTNIIQELVWRDLCFIKALGGKDCCLLADSTQVDENHELTAYLVSWVSF